MPSHPTLTCAPTAGFETWLAGSGVALAVTTCQAGVVLLIDAAQDRLRVRTWDGPRPMGLASDGPRMAVACRREIVVLHDLAPVASHTVGDVDVHDLAIGRDGLWFVNTKCSSLCVMDEGGAIEARWRPSFVSALTPEDRCHLNGLAMEHGRPRFVTALGATDEAGAWRSRRTGGGVLIDVESGDTIVSDLCMPHSPRGHRGKWWLLNSGRGELCRIDPDAGRVEVVGAVPGYARGLCFAGGHAVVGMSRVRPAHLFDGLPLRQRFERLRCGLAVIDVETGATVGMLELTGCEELYDVQVAPAPLRLSY
ncbi:MAG: TIGR03032 family protein [Phycisphaeraceae bacterium]|nr:TIGR03032 family protein [Phycisphaeraceae bacterium]